VLLMWAVCVNKWQCGNPVHKMVMGAGHSVEKVTPGGVGWVKQRAVSVK